MLTVGGHGRVGLGHHVLVFLRRGEVIDLVGDLSVDHTTVRRLNEAERVDAGKRSQRTDQTNVGAFRSFDGTHAAVVRRVNVTHVNTGTLTRQTTGAERRKTTLVGEARERVVLIHELRELAGAKELLDGSHDGTHVDERLRRDGLNVLRGHALAHHTLHAAEARAHLVLDELTHGADTTVTEVVDVIHGERDFGLLAVAKTGNLNFTAGQELLIGSVHGHEVLDRGNDIGHVEHRLAQGQVETELLVELVTAHLGEVVALGVEVVVLEEHASGLGSNLLSRTQLAVNVFEGFFLCEDVVLLEREFDRLESGKLLADVFGGEAEGLEEDGDRLLALAVDAHAHLVALVNLELEPRTAAGNHAGREDVFVRRLVAHALEVHTGATHELRHNNTLGAVDHEGALFGHQGEVAHEDGLGLDLTRVVVHELRFDVQRGGVGLAALLALVERVLLFFEVRVRERELHRLIEVLDGRDLFENLLEAGTGGEVLATFLLGLGNTLLPLLVADEPRKGLGLQIKQIGHLEGVGDFGERKSRRIATALVGLGTVARSSQDFSSVGP